MQAWLSLDESIGFHGELLTNFLRQQSGPPPKDGGKAAPKDAKAKSKV